MTYKDPNDPRIKEQRCKHYANNKAQYMANNKLKKARMRAYVDQIKANPCMDCGVCYPPYVMDFDHRDATIKVMGVSKILAIQSWSKLKTEIDKCDLVCANCHRIRTHGRWAGR